MLLIVSGILVIISVREFNNRNLDSPLFVFSILWTAIFALYSFRMYGIYDIGVNSIFLLGFGCLSVVIGYGFWTHVRIGEHNEYDDLNLRFSIFTIISIIIVITSLSFYLVNIRLVIQGLTVAELKKRLVTGELGWGGVWMQYIVRPFEYIIIACSAYCMILYRKKKIIISCGLLLTLFEFVGVGSKTAVMFLVICILLAYLSNRDQLGFELKRRKKLVSISLVVLLLILYFRAGIKKLYLYLCGCIPLFDRVINDKFYMQDGFSYGFLSFNSLIRLFIKGLSVFGIDINSSLFDTANSYFVRFEKTMQVADGVDYNAFHTIWGDFYVDFGWIGVIVLSFVFGAVLCYFYRRYKQYRSIDMFIILCILMYYVVFSGVRFQMSNTYFGLMLIYSVLFLKKIFYGTTRIRIGNLKI